MPTIPSTTAPSQKVRGLAPGSAETLARFAPALPFSFLSPALLVHGGGLFLFFASPGSLDPVATFVFLGLARPALLAASA